MNASGIPIDLIMGKLAEDVEKTEERMLKSMDVLLGPLETSIATTPCEIVYEEDRVKLKHYLPLAETRVKTPLLMVYALINRETMLDLQPGKSVVENVLKEGIDLYMIDWGYPTRKDHYQGIDDHVNGYLDNIVDFIRERHGVPKIHLMGICMGGSFCIMYSALHPEKVKNLITTVTPSNFANVNGLLFTWMRALDPDLVVETHGNMPGDLLNIGFLLLNPARLMLDKYVNYFENVGDKVFVENFIRMEKWIFDSPDVPGETFREFIKDCFRDNLLIQSKMELGGKRVDLKNITMPLLNIYGRFDHLVPPAAAELLTGRVGSKDTEDLCLDTGHIGIYVSSKCQKELAPKIASWLLARDGDEGEVVAPPSAGKDQPKPESSPKSRPSSSKQKKAENSGRVIMKSADKKDYFNTICTVSRAFGTTLNRDGLLKLIVGNALETMNVKAALLFLHDEERDQFRAVAQKGLSETYIKKGLTQPGKLVPTLEKEGHFFALDCTTDSRVDGHDLKKAEGLASLLVVPVMVKGKLIGGLALFTGSPRNFSQEEIDFAAAMAEQGGMAIENARLIEQIRQNTKLFLDLAVDINSSLNVKEVLQALTVHVAETLNVKGSALLLLDEKTKKLECVASHGLSDRYLGRGPLFIEGSIQQTLEGNPVLIRDVATDSRVKHKKEKKKEGIVSLLSLPIKTKQDIIGVLRLYSGVVREFNEDEIKLLTALAHLGGIAIQNASLYLMLEKDMKDLREEIWTHRTYF